MATLWNSFVQLKTGYFDILYNFDEPVKSTKAVKVVKSGTPECRCRMSPEYNFVKNRLLDSRPTDSGNDEMGRMQDYGFEDFLRLCQFSRFIVAIA
ncbi:MAG TPA: hypothetical protein ENK96_06050 [Desulfobulbaceae bacterium]|nr:hypothetical protein [Desulfobulbaceae bacterium]